MKFGLMLFASSEDALAAEDKYELVIESARFGDRHGFSSVWVPERHFTRFGALYPNPAVLHAALAMVTRRIRLHAGSVVTPLHHALRIAEEWAVVDNLSGGRVGISFASGWNPDDFAFFPERYANRHDEMYKGIATVQRLWRGETLSVTSGNGKAAEVRIYPTPVQKELPICLTAAGNPQTYQAAGRLGADLLTHILDQEIERLAEKIALYREARRAAGFDPAAGQVTLMLHTFVGTELERAREQARRPYCEYLKANIGLLGGVAESRGRKIDVTKLSEAHMDEFVNYLYDRFASTRGLIGTPESCLELVRQCAAIGVDEIACLLDFGPDKQQVLDNLPHLDRLKNLYAAAARGQGAALVNGSAADLKADNEAGHKAGHEDALLALDEIKGRCGEELTGDAFHALMEQGGIHIAADIRFVERLWRRDGEALAQLRLAQEYAADGDYQLHPAVLDACGRVLAAALPRHLLTGSGGELYLPVGVGAFRLQRAPRGGCFAHALLQPAIDAGSLTDSSLQTAAATAMNATPPEWCGDVAAYDEQGKLLFAMKDLKLRRARAAVAAVGKATELAHRLQPAGTPDENYLYRRVWQVLSGLSVSDLARDEQAATVTTTPAQQQSGDGWLIFADRQGIGARLAARLTARGHRCTLIESVAAGADLKRLLDDALQSASPLRGVVHLWSLDAPPASQLTTATLARAQQRAVQSALQLVQTLTATSAENAAKNAAKTAPKNARDGATTDGKTARLPLYFVTRGAMPIAATDGNLAIAQSPLWGFARALAVEHPNLWGGLLDLAPTDDEPAGDEPPNDESVNQKLPANARDHRATKQAQDAEEAAAMLQQWLAPAAAEARQQTQNEDLVGIRGGAYHVARLESYAPPLPSTAPQFSAQATYLLTGGLGGLGRQLALWMAERGARHLCLLSRAASQGSAADFLNELQRRGVEVVLARADVANEAELTQALHQLDKQCPPLRGIFHLAGNLDDALLVNESWEHLTQASAPKVAGAWNLHRLTLDKQLDYFVLFSSAASLLMTGGQANYAMANSFLDALAHYRRGQGLAALSVNWGPWAQVGHAATDYGREAHARLRFLGVQPLAVATGLALLETLLTNDEPQVGAIALDWQRLFENDPAVQGLPFFSEMAARHAPRVTLPNAAPTPVMQTLGQLQRSERQAFLMDFLTQNIRQTLKLDAGFRLTPRQQLFELGFDSILALEFKNRLEQSLGRPFKATLLFLHPTLESLTAYLLDEALGLSISADDAASAEAMPTTTTAAPLANLDAISEEQMLALLLREIEAGRQ